MTPSPRPGRWPRGLRRHRRLLAAVLLAVAAGTAVRSVVPEAAGTTVLTAAHDLPAGHVVSGADLATVLVPEAAVPDGVLHRGALEGARLASAVRAGEAVTDARVSGTGLTRTLPAGEVAVPVLVAAHALPWLQVGQRVRLHTAPAQGIAAWDGPGAAAGADDLVVEVATVLDIADAPEAGLHAAGGTGSVPVLVQVPDAEAGRLAGAAGPVTAVLLGGS